MSMIKRFIYIDAPPDAVSEIGLRTDLLPEWFEGVTSADPDPAFPAEGSTMRVTMRVTGFSFEVTQTVLEYEPAEKLVLRIEGVDGRVSATTTWYYRQEGDRSKVSLHYAYDTPSLGFMFKPIIERMSTENVERSLRNLKLLVEREYAAS